MKPYLNMRHNMISTWMVIPLGGSVDHFDYGIISLHRISNISPGKYKAISPGLSPEQKVIDKDTGRT